MRSTVSTEKVIVKVIIYLSTLTGTMLRIDDMCTILVFIIILTSVELSLMSTTNYQSNSYGLLIITLT